MKLSVLIRAELIGFLLTGILVLIWDAAGAPDPSFQVCVLLGVCIGVVAGGWSVLREL